METNDEENESAKLQRLKYLLSGALRQIRKKLEVIEIAIIAISSPGDITGDTKLLCTILIEIRELLKHYPSMQDDEETNSEENSPPEEIHPKILKFRNNVFSILKNIKLRLEIVEEFVSTTDSMPQAMTIAVTVRDITMHLKVVTPHKGSRVISMPGNSPKLTSAKSMNSTNVSNIVNYYSNLSNSGELRKRSTPLTNLQPETKKETPEEPENEPDSGKRKHTTRTVSRILNVEEQKKMEDAVNSRMETLTKKRGGVMQSMLQGGAMTEFFNVTDQRKHSITKLLDEGKIYYSGELSKKYYSVKSFGKIWKNHYWVLTTEHLSCYQSAQATIPMKRYTVAHIKCCSWSNNLHQLQHQAKLDSVTLIAQGDRKLTLKGTTELEVIRWVCALDTVQSNSEVESILNPMDKHRLLELGYKHYHKGGEIQSSYEEDWSYSAGGVLSSSMGVSPPLKYRWDGEMLIGLDQPSRELGSGKWNGISLVWYSESCNGMISTPTVRFDWNQNAREYTNIMEPTQVWMWTRHFLASKFGGGEWIVEGDIPEPVVMFLQMIRTSRLQQSVEDLESKEPENEGVKNEEANISSNPGE